MPPIFAERLRIAMALRNMNNVQLAKQLGRQPRTVGNWCNGSTQPIASDIAACSEALDVAADFLVGRVDDPSGLVPGSWVLGRDLLDRARSHPGDEVVPGFRVPPRPIVVTEEEATRLFQDISRQRRKGHSNG